MPARPARAHRCRSTDLVSIRLKTIRFGFISGMVPGIPKPTSEPSGGHGQNCVYVMSRWRSIKFRRGVALSYELWYILGKPGEATPTKARLTSTKDP